MIIYEKMKTVKIKFLLFLVKFAKISFAKNIENKKRNYNNFFYTLFYIIDYSFHN